MTDTSFDLLLAARHFSPGAVGVGFEGEKLRQAQAQKADRAHLEQVAPGHAVAGTIHIRAELSQLFVVHENPPAASVIKMT